VGAQDLTILGREGRKGGSEMVTPEIGADLWVGGGKDVGGGSVPSRILQKEVTVSNENCNL